MDDFIMMPIPVSSFTAVCTLLGGVSVIPAVGKPRDPASFGMGDVKPEAGLAKVEIAEMGNGLSGEATGADDDTVDAAGWPWDAAMHASTRTMTKEGLWRMKVGVSRPDAKPGFPKAEAQSGTGTPAPTQEAPAGATAAIPAAGEDEDEFAAFRAAADKGNAADEAAASSVPARKWTDADLGALCNQAATKLSDAAPVKAVITKYVPDGTVPHSRNIPQDEREAFAAELEKVAGITFAG